jgi:hypothetical protein
MAFTLEVIRGATTYNISAGQSIAIENIDDLGGASVRNQEESGPYQDGSSHIGERLEPRTMTLRLNVVGSSASALDGHRDTLNAMFKPVRGVPIILKVTRDDGEVRQVDCRRTGPLAIPLHKMDRPGNLHRAVVQLRAADPTFYNPTEQDEDFNVPTANWWTGFETIGTANVLEHVENPAQGQLWANTGSVAAGSPWTIFFRSGSVALGSGTVRFAFNENPDLGAQEITFNSENLAYRFGGGPNSALGSYMSAGTANYFLVANGGTVVLFRDGIAVGTATGATTSAIFATGADVARWRSPAGGSVGVQNWTEALPYAAIYSGSLSPTQRDAVHQAVTTFGSAQSAIIVYEGDWYSYPIITINGPIANPVITNTTTGDILDFTGGTVGTAETWVIDTRYGFKSALSGTTSVERYLSNDSDLATFRLAPDPVVTGGTNVVTVSGTAMGSATQVTLAYYNRYMGF